MRGAEKSEVILGKYSRELGRAGKEIAKTLMEGVERKKTSIWLIICIQVILIRIEFGCNQVRET